MAASVISMAALLTKQIRLVKGKVGHLQVMKISF